MATQEQDQIANVLRGLPNPKAIRHRIAENMQERTTLRQLLRLAEQKSKASAIGEKGKRDD